MERPMMTPFRRALMWGIVFFMPAVVNAGGAGQAAVPMPAAECRAVLKQMAQSLAVHGTLKARFVQERRLALFDDVLKMAGYFYYQKPGRIRWEFTEPYASIILLLEDGRTERFDIAGGKAVKSASEGVSISGEVLNQISRWLNGDLEPALKDFDVQMVRGASYLLTLHPKSEAMSGFISRLEFEIEPRSYLVLAINLWEAGNDVTRIRFTSQSVDTRLPDRIFDSKDPRLLGESER
ncbi:MAG: outer membrane lipoprotein carrier protein LolA [Acidobacteriota bacterium]|nr:outer membrane lipoprotein carrier protein LolA [Acidobacteriota bacterium]